MQARVDAARNNVTMTPCMKSPTPGRLITQATRGGSTTLIVTTAKQVASIAVHTSTNQPTGSSRPVPCHKLAAPAIYSPHQPLSIIHHPLVRSRTPSRSTETRQPRLRRHSLPAQTIRSTVRTVHTSTGMGDRSRGFESRLHRLGI